MGFYPSPWYVPGLGYVRWVIVCSGGICPLGYLFVPVESRWYIQKAMDTFYKDGILCTGINVPVWIWVVQVHRRYTGVGSRSMKLCMYVRFLLRRIVWWGGPLPRFFCPFLLQVILPYDQRTNPFYLPTYSTFYKGRNVI